MADDCCDVEIDASRLESRQRRVLVWVTLINVGTFAMMVAAARSSGSTALLSGALDNLGDALTYALSILVVGAGLAAKARVALFKGVLIALAALVVAIQIGVRLFDPSVPLFETMGLAAAANLAANAGCLWLLSPYRDGDVNLASAWECSRNDVAEGVAVLLAAGAVAVFASRWPDLVIATGLLVVFARSATRVLRRAWTEVRTPSSST